MIRFTDKPAQPSSAPTATEKDQVARVRKDAGKKADGGKTGAKATEQDGKLL